MTPLTTIHSDLLVSVIGGQAAPAATQQQQPDPNAGASTTPAAADSGSPMSSFFAALQSLFSFFQTPQGQQVMTAFTSFIQSLQPPAPSGGTAVAQAPASGQTPAAA